MQVEDRLILSCIKINPDQSELELMNQLIPQVLDWDYFISTIIDRGAGPLFYKKIPLLANSYQIPPIIKTKLQQSYYLTLSRSVMLYEHFREVMKAFNEAEIDIIALKGIYLSEKLYGDIGLRQFSDIDLLVKEEDGEKCIAILEQSGYHPSGYKVAEFVRKNTETLHFPPMIKDGISIEIHTKLHKKRETYEMDIKSVWDNASSITLNGAKVLVPDLYDQLIHLCLHLDKHFRGGHVQFTCFNDISNFVEINRSIIDWNLLIEKCKSCKCESIVFGYLLLVQQYMNVLLPENITEKYSSSLTNTDRQLFIRYLHGDMSESAYKMHSKNLRNVKGAGAKIKYGFHLLFPPKAFMIQLYKIKQPSLAIFYYPFRHYKGLKALMSYLKKSKS